MSLAPAPLAPAGRGDPSALLHLLERVGGPVRRGVAVALSVAALAAGVVVEALYPATWRRSVRAEFRRCLRQSVAGGIGTVLATAVLAGLGLVYQALYWLGVAGQQGSTGDILVTVLVREITPIAAGLVLLGRSGVVTVVEFGEIAASGQQRVLEGQGIDPFQLLVLPRTLAYAVAGFTLGMLFLTAALATGYLAGAQFGIAEAGFEDFLTMVVNALGRRDFLVLPVKLVLAGALVALTATVTGLGSSPQEKPVHLLPRGFVRGTLAVLGSSVVLSVVAW